jgi:hypothetical protein
MKLFISAITALTLIPAAFCRDIPGCAHIRESRRCNRFNYGKLMMAVNERKDKQLRVTVHETGSCSDHAVNNYKTYTIAAGGGNPSDAPTYLLLHDHYEQADA